MPHPRFRLRSLVLLILLAGLLSGGMAWWLKRSAPAPDAVDEDLRGVDFYARASAGGR